MDTFIEETLDGKLQFLCSEIYSNQPLNLIILLKLLFDINFCFMCYVLNKNITKELLQVTQLINLLQILRYDTL